VARHLTFLMGCLTFSSVAINFAKRFDAPLFLFP
jgi:hypothetical protein